MSRVFQAIALLATTAAAHSWIEQMQLISSNGSYTGDLGYPRGYVARTDHGFNGYSDKWQLPSPETELGRIRINSSDYLCHPSQRTANYSTTYPKLKVSPDSYIAMRYLENGHVTQPWIPAGKPAGSGTVFVYGTYSPSNEEKIVDVLQWTTDGKGGNGKGFLLTAQNFDDDRCYQANVSPISVSRQMVDSDMAVGEESWCETDLHIPADAKAGSTLAIYWVWSWQTSPETEGAPCGKDEYYTTCADVDIGGSSLDAKALFVAPVVHTLVQQDPRKQAVGDYKSRTAFMTAPNLVTTEACDVKTITSSSLPASMTAHTTLPEAFLATYSQHQAQEVVATEATSTASLALSTLTLPFSSLGAFLSSELAQYVVSSSVPASTLSQMTTTVFSISVQTVTYVPPVSTSQPAPVVAASSSASVLTTSTSIQSSAPAPTTSSSSLISTSATTTSTSTLILPSTKTATTTVAPASLVPQPSFAYSPTSSVADTNGMIGNVISNGQGMIGQNRIRRRRGSLVV